MLDMHAAALAMVALWQFSAATRSGRPRLHLALCGVAMGLALGAKWSVIPVIVLPGLAMLFARIASDRAHFLTARDSRRWQAYLWSRPRCGSACSRCWSGRADLRAGGVLPRGRARSARYRREHRLMIQLQDSVVKFHPYRSEWWQWIVNGRPIWYLYEPVDGAWRWIPWVPVHHWIALPALGWCLWAGFRQGRDDALAMAAAYGANMAFWIASSKPVMFYYHYLLPGTFLLGCPGARRSTGCGWRGSLARITAACVLGLSVGVFVRSDPILSAAPLAGGKNAFVEWMWLDSWRDHSAGNGRLEAMKP